VKTLRALVLFLILLIVPGMASAQSNSLANNHLHVFLVTFGPGSDPWEKFGHDCIVIEDLDAGTSGAYNWGMFTFGEGTSGFISFGVQFLRGRLNYFMQSDPTDMVLEGYKRAGRSVLVQELRVAPDQRLALQARLMLNDTDANRYYLYDYFKRNCATQCRDEINKSVSGQLESALTQVPTGTTYRWQDQRCTADCLWLYVFLDYTLGHGVDIPINAWQESFLPGKLASHLRSIKVRDQSGNLVPIVMSEKQLATSTFPERDVPPKSFFYYFLGFGVIGGLMLAGLARVGTRYWVLRWLFNLVVMGWSLLMGLLGTLLSYAVFSDHVAAKWNENWFQGNPASLLLIVLVPMALRWPNLAKRGATVVLAGSVFGLLAKVTPWFWQTNGQLIAAALPIHAGIAWGICKITSATRSPMVSAATKNTEPANAGS
jgi:hypothetical protein